MARPDASAGASTATADARYLQVSPYAVDEGHLIGKVPAEISMTDLRALGHPAAPLRAIRANCRACVGSETEIRKCVQHSCPLWPMRMGRNPFHGAAKHPGGGDVEPPDDPPERRSPGAASTRATSKTNQIDQQDTDDTSDAQAARDGAA